MPEAVRKEEDEQKELDREDERALFAQAIADDPDISDDDKGSFLGATEKREEKEEKEEKEEVEQNPAKQKEEADDTNQPSVDHETTGFEWLEDLPEEKRDLARGIVNRQGQQIARLDQRVRSHLGQLRPAQRLISELQRKVRQFENDQPKQTQGGFDGEANKRAYNDRIDSEYKEFPEEADKLKTLYAESLDGVLRSIPAPQPERKQQAQTGPDPQNEMQHLSTAYSDWGERRFSPEFNQWIRTQPQDMQQILNSPFAADNIALLDAFTESYPDWEAPQQPKNFYSVQQAQHSPLFRGWAEAEGINPDTNFGSMPDIERDWILNRFKSDLASAYADDDGEVEQDDRSQKLANRRKQQLKDRSPGSRRTAVRPGQQIDLDTEEGQRAYFKMLVDDDPDLRN